MTLAQLDAAFSASRKCEKGEDISIWGHLGLAREWRDRPLQMFGRGAASGTRDYFRQQALCGGDFKNAVVTQSTSAALVRAVANSLNAIGYAGLTVVTGTPFVEPSAANALAGTYLLTRYLYICVDKPPGRPLPSAIDAFIRLVLSERGLQSVARTGYIPLPVSLATRELMQLQ
jgi:phosphate transport system substrate-binding protein